jgi:hypothetical protein
MLFMNEYDIDDALDQYVYRTPDAPEHMRAAVITLHNVMTAANSCSDGWHSWPKPARAARKLMELIQRQQKVDRERYSMLQSDRDLLTVTEKEVWAAYSPLKAFRTREIGKSDIWFTIHYGGK